MLIYIAKEILSYRKISTQRVHLWDKIFSVLVCLVHKIDCMIFLKNFIQEHVKLAAAKGRHNVTLQKYFQYAKLHYSAFNVRR